MANGNGNGNGNGSSHAVRTVFVVGGTSLVAALTLVVNLFIGVSKDAQIAISVAEQHGQELLEVRAQLHQMREEMRESTRDRYYRREADRDNARLEQMIRDYHGK